MRLLLLAVLAAASTASAQNVLRGRMPMRADNVPFAARITDGQSPIDGDPWDGPSAAVLPAGGAIEWDLERPTHLSGAALQADNNDDYLLQISDDGVNWRDFWHFGPMEGGGLRTRSMDGLEATARYLRLTGAGGDMRYSISELELFDASASDSVLLRARWVPRRALDQSFLSWLGGMAVILFIAGRRLRGLPLLVLGGIGLASTYWLMFETTKADPQALLSLPWIRGAVALLALVAVVREHVWRGTWPSHPTFTVGAMGVAGAMAMWCFLNLGSPQFHDSGQGKMTWLHHYDMRTYFPIAKYFPELRFDGVYAASVMAVAEGRPLEFFSNQPIRDLRTHELKTVGTSREHLEEVRARFSPERWALFQQDMNYFRRAMSDGGFLGSMNDHGGNATPVWFLTARLLFASAPASDATLWRGVIADLVLLAMAFLALGWAWGPRTAFLALTVFGAMDFYQFGSNWFGATLRHDWLSLWAIGLALLQKRKFALAGAAFAWSAWIRAFPALTFITLSFPVLWVGTKLLLQSEKQKALETAKPLLRVVLGVAIASVVLVGLSVVIFGADAWAEWLRKVQTLDKDNHLNNISFRTYISVDKGVWRATVVGSVLALLVALRRASLARAAVWGVALVPIIFNPANYYLHSAFLLVTLAAEQHGKVSLRGMWVWVVLLLMCFGSYVTNIPTDVGVHFRQDTIVCFAALLALFVLEIGRPRET